MDVHDELPVRLIGARLLALAGGVAFAGCGATVTPADGAALDHDVVAMDAPLADTPVPPDAPTRVPSHHRTDNAACVTTRAAVNCDSTPGGPSNTCTTDSQCSTGVDGRCVRPGIPIALCTCTYDTCSSDAECSMGGPCACHGSAFLAQAGNRCVPGNCQVDANCGAGGYCSPAMNANNCGSLMGYYCHTAQDDCIEDSDCRAMPRGPQICTYSPMAAKWTCMQEEICV